MPRLGDTPSPNPHTYNPTPQPDMDYYHHSRVPSMTGGYYEQIPSNGAGASVAETTANPYSDPFAVTLPLTMPPSTTGLGAPTIIGSNATRSTDTAGSTSSYMLQPPPPPHQHLRTSSGAWSPQDDDALLQARARGKNWSQIHQQFQGKTANACRKRHERLMERRNADDFDTRKMEEIALAYVSMRREIWEGLAQRTGEKWSTVEQKCLSSGLKNLQSMARAASRHRENGAAGATYALGRHHPSIHAQHSAPPVVAYDDQDYNDSGGSGLSGGGMSSPGDEVEVEAVGSSSPGGSSSSGSLRHPSQQHRHQHSHSHSLGQSSMHLQPPTVTVAPPVQDVGSPSSYADYYATQPGFTQSLRSMGMVPQSQPPSSRHHQSSSHHHHSLTSPYMSGPHGLSGDRMSAVDMGIASLIDSSTSRGPL